MYIQIYITCKTNKTNFFQEIFVIFFSVFVQKKYNEHHCVYFCLRIKGARCISSPCGSSNLTHCLPVLMPGSGLMLLLLCVCVWLCYQPVADGVADLTA